jgi:two-component SAPR family response regulator
MSETSTPRRAADAYRKAVAHDELLEEAHRTLMRCQAALGERGRVIRHYEELVGSLANELGAPGPRDQSAPRAPARRRRTLD